MTNYSTSPNDRITKVVKASKEERQRIILDIRRRRALMLAQRAEGAKIMFNDDKEMG